MVKEAQDLSGASFIGYYPFMRAPFLWPNHFPKVPSLNTITLKGNISTSEFWGHKYSDHYTNPVSKEWWDITKYNWCVKARKEWRWKGWEEKLKECKMGVRQRMKLRPTSLLIAALWFVSLLCELCICNYTWVNCTLTGLLSAAWVG